MVAIWRLKNIFVTKYMVIYLTTLPIAGYENEFKILFIINDAVKNIFLYFPLFWLTSLGKKWNS